MRISTQMFYQRNTATVMSQQAELSNQNIHLASQKRVLYASDDAVAIATIQRLKQDLSMGEQYIKNGEMANAAVSLEETALEQTTNILQRVRELMVTAGNETYNAENREAIAQELVNLREELAGVANTKDGNSQYIFAGYQVDTQPFQTNEFGSIDYHGDEGTRDYKVGSGVFVQGSDSGAAIFVNIAEGNGTFVSEGNTNNTGSGVINEASVIDSKVAKPFLDEDYTITMSESPIGSDPDYSVYGLKEGAVTGDAKITASSIDVNAAGFAGFDPAVFDPSSATNGLDISFVANGPLIDVSIGGVIASPSFDPSNTEPQTVSVNGFSFEIDGIPDLSDTYSFNKYVPPTPYKENQSIQFNGIKTTIKGDVDNLDNFTLRQSDTKDIFATIQDSIDALRIPGEDGVAKSQREMAFDMARHQIDNTMTNVSNVRTSVGARMRTIENQYESSSDFNLTNRQALSNLEDLDMAAAISEFQQQMTVLEISQQTYVKMQGLSLFNLI